MAEDQSKKRATQETKISNAISDETGQYDARFMFVAYVLRRK